LRRSPAEHVQEGKIRGPGANRLLGGRREESVMKCMVLEQFNSPLVARDRSIPVPGAADAILKVGAAGLCRTDLKFWHGSHPAIHKLKLPVVLGHEVAGEVVEVGNEVDKDLIGKHAVIYFYLSCGQCAYCKAGSEILCGNLSGQIGFSWDGGFAEYVRVPASSLFPVPREIPFPQAAIVTDAIATPYRALTRKAKVKPGETLVLIGVGGLGIHAVQIGKVMGARVVAVDINDKALALAKKVGADEIIQVNTGDPKQQILELSRGGVAVVADFVANAQSQALGLGVLKPQGRFVSVAYAIDNVLHIGTPQLVSAEIEVYGSRSCGRQDLKETIDLLARGKVKSIIAECYPLSEINTALEKLEKGDLVGRSVVIP